MAMTLRQLQYLVTIVDSGSFTRAAERLHVSQPALSRQLQSLERTCGGPLVERGSRPVLLTPLGRAVLPHARATLAEVDRANSAAQRVSGNQRLELRVATLYSVSFGVLPPALAAWRRERPDTLLSLTEQLHVGDLQEAMTTGEADVAVGPPPSDWQGPVFPLGSEEFVVVLGADDPLLRRPGPHIRLTELAGHEWLHYTAPNGLARILDCACANAGFQPRVAVQTQQTATALQLSTAGLGPTLFPANIVPAGLTPRVRIPDPPVHRVLGAYTRSHPDALTASFIDTLTRHASLVPPHLPAQEGTLGNVVEIPLQRMGNVVS
ncbi:LysR family transcriptional regulator [Streptomyces sp. AV19]|uniref:LysR family transcriptional regulator n=1 Tax=Streptomyces sp. AV19 TaxID=2793068 RepID=UPI0018FED3EA|nr:LysR family transcriptional regulator [Streptomyces sp. AV19]MBH1934824.1 LysR family transcriptional regulator [Streptomyces sp. AV19]MDG4530571.1 LysR family transcriptional regulator [Streptomyces sp. AV19]